MTAPADLFSPAHYAATRRPPEAARGLPDWCYTDPAWHAREIERLFRRGWQFIGRADTLPEPGCYRAIELPDGPVLALRGRDGTLRAFLNACRHRGARLLDGEGRCQAIACPYHAWSYGLDGALLGAPGMHAVPGFARADWGLMPLRLADWQGFLFVTADPALPPLEDWLGDLVERFACYRFDRMVQTRGGAYEVGCNWKLLAENAMEEYHTGVVHKGSLGQQHGVAEETRGAWDALYIPQATSIAVLPGETAPFAHGPELQGRPAAGSYFTMLLPNLQLACTQDCMWWLAFRPLAPDRTRLEVGFVFPRDTAARPDFQALVAPYYRRWDISIAEDNAIGAVQQAGLRARGRPPGPYAPSERAVHKLHRRWLDAMLDG